MLFVIVHFAQHHDYFFFIETATTEIYTLSLHDALPISVVVRGRPYWSCNAQVLVRSRFCSARGRVEDRKSTRLNSSHQIISYAVFCLKKKTSGSRDYFS